MRMGQWLKIYKVWRQVSWQRAARTDKGVSAAGNVVSLKLMIDFPDVVERINVELPDQVLLAM